VKLSMLDQMRVWASVTGLLLVVCFFGALYLGYQASPMLPMLVAAIGGFELFLYAQDLWLKRKSRHG
jgi:hypothetical protein